MTVRFLTLHPMAIGVPIVVGTMDGDLADRPHLAITRGQRAVLGWFDQQQRVKYVDFIGSTATVHDVPFSGLPHLDNILVGSDRTILAVGASTGPGTMTLVTYRQCGDPYPVETCTPANVTSGTVCSTEAP